MQKLTAWFLQAWFVIIAVEVEYAVWEEKHCYVQERYNKAIPWRKSSNTECCY